MGEMTIDGVLIDDNSPCYVIAEVGHNHQGKLETCKQMFLAAKECGANAVKLQKRDNRTLYSQAMYHQPYDNENSFGATYGEHREALEFNREQYAELQAYCREIQITMFATAFDIPSANFLRDLDMPAYKIASGDLTNIPLIKHVAKIGKPMIISTGGGTMEDIQRAYDAVWPINQQLCFLQCTAAYPCEFEEMNLLVIPTLKRKFPDTVVGLSAHDNGITMAVAAYPLGSRVVEKHFTLNRAMKGTDHAFSLERTGMQKMVRDLRRVQAALGDGEKKQYPSETKPLLKMAKKLVAARDIPAGTVLTEEDITFMSPGDGMLPYRIDELIGATLTRSLSKEDAFHLEHLEKTREPLHN